jgi:hypothetical protein
MLYPFAKTGHETRTTELNSSGNVIVIMTKQLHHHEGSLVLKQNNDTSYLAVIRHILRNRSALNYEKAYFQNKNHHVFFFCLFYALLFRNKPTKN